MAAEGNRSIITCKKIGVPRQRQQLQFKVEIGAKMCANPPAGGAMPSATSLSWVDAFRSIYQGFGASEIQGP